MEHHCKGNTKTFCRREHPNNSFDKTEIVLIEIGSARHCRPKPTNKVGRYAFYSVGKRRCRIISIKVIVLKTDNGWHRKCVSSCIEASGLFIICALWARNGSRPAPARLLCADETDIPLSNWLFTKMSTLNGFSNKNVSAVMPEVVQWCDIDRGITVFTREIGLLFEFLHRNYRHSITAFGDFTV